MGNGRDARTFVWHFVLVREGRPPASGERLGTFVLGPDEVARQGLARIRQAVEHERRNWARRALAMGYVDGYGVQTVHERGFSRSLFPAAALPGLDAAPRPAILYTPKGGLS